MQNFQVLLSQSPFLLNSSDPALKLTETLFKYETEKHNHTNTDYTEQERVNELQHNNIPTLQPYKHTIVRHNT